MVAEHILKMTDNSQSRDNFQVGLTRIYQLGSFCIFHFKYMLSIKEIKKKKEISRRSKAFWVFS